MSTQVHLVSMVVRVCDGIKSGIESQTKFHIVVLALHRMNKSLIERGAMRVCRPKPPEDIAVVQCSVVDRFHFRKLV